jgi:hypothetical protein
MHHTLYSLCTILYSHSEWIGAEDDGYLPHQQNERLAWEMQQDGTTINTPPPRPYPTLKKCSTGDIPPLTQQWEWSNINNGGTVCTKAGKFGKSACFNVQSGLNRLILWPKGTDNNDLFDLESAAADSTAGNSSAAAISSAAALMHSAVNRPGGCVGASGVGGELVLVDNCTTSTSESQMLTHGWSFDAKTGEISIGSASGDGMLCVTADLNGTKPGPSPKKGPCSAGCLFNVVADPTEQTNLYSSRPDLVANLTASLNEFQKGFYKNKDKFMNACPSGTKDCACYLAKNKYGGFMGPYAMLEMDPTRELEPPVGL